MHEGGSDAYHILQLITPDDINQGFVWVLHLFNIKRYILDIVGLYFVFHPVHFLSTKVNKALRFTSDL